MFILIFIVSRSRYFFTNKPHKKDQSFFHTLILNPVSWYRDVCCILIYIAVWFLLYPDIYCILIFIAVWFLLYPDIHCNLIFIVSWYLLYPDIYCNLIFIVSWYLLYSDILYRPDFYCILTILHPGIYCKFWYLL